jgi:hypothetical protein
MLHVEEVLGAFVIIKEMNIKKFFTRIQSVSGTPEVEIPQGPIRVHVQGEGWRSKPTSKVTLEVPVKFSLTPKNDYQIRNGWPEGEFYNVNSYPSTATTQNNWIGYVSYLGKPTATQIAELVNAGEKISVWGFFEIEDGELNAVITIPRKL